MCFGSRRAVLAVISVVNKLAMESDQATGAADPATFGVENPQEGPRVSDGTAVPAEIDPTPVVRVLENEGVDVSSGESKMEVEESMVSESEAAVEGCPLVEAGIERSLSVQEKNLVLNQPVTSKMALASRAVSSPEIWMRGFEIGDMVWGKVKSHPWWPGYIFNASFAPPDVRRTKKEGHVLVAFLGDSSYGWFLPDELIPFDPSYLEKSKQTTAKNFVKAVDEAEDEVSRRAALGLTCCCRNPKNFRYFGFPGYLRVDVPGYERGAEYSMEQIDSARDSFVPEDMMSFLQQLALSPQSELREGVDFIRNKARLLAYRKAVFEEFDETYPQAFGVEPVRPSPIDAETTDQADYFAPRAIPLRGQMKIAENLGDGRVSSSRPIARSPKISSSSSKKNKYVLKRREERGVQHENSIGGPFRPSPLPDLRSPPAQQYGTTTAVHYFDSPPASNYVLQKRPQVTFEGVLGSSVPKETKLVSGPSDVQPAYAGVSTTDTTVTSQTQAFDDRRLKTEPLLTDEKVGTEPGRLDDHSNNFKLEAKPAIDLPAPSSRAVEELVKKDKVRKRLREDGGSGGPDDIGEIKKKKKKKNILHIEAVDGGESRGKLAGKSIGIGLRHAEVDRIESERRDDGVSGTSDLNSSSAPQHRVDLSSLCLEFPQLLRDLRELALDPFYGTEHHAPSTVLQVFGKFRMQVYQKSVLPSAGEPDMAELRGSRVAAGRSLQEPGAGNADFASVKDHKGSSSFTLKPLKPKMKPDALTKDGRKRGSDRQEEMIARKVKKMNQLKALATEKKAGLNQKVPESQQRNQKESGTVTTTLAASAKPNNNKVAEPVKKQEPPPPPLPFSPTALVLKFQPRTTLPSVATLKAKFARFGSVIEGATRVYWKSHSVKVVFKHKPHAQAALNYVRKNNDFIYGQSKVQCHIRELDPATLEPSTDPAKPRPPESRPTDGPLRLGIGGNGNGGSLPQPQALPYQQQRGAPAGQLKSILKKPSDEGGQSAGNAAREAPQRVTFLLEGDNRAAPPIVPAASSGGAGSHAAGPSSSSHAAAPSSSLPPLDPITSKNPKSTAGFLPQPSPMLHSAPPNPPRTFNMLQLPPPSPLSPQSMSLPPPPRAVDGSLPPPPPIPQQSIALPPPPSRVVDGSLPPPPLLPQQSISLPPPSRVVDGPFPPPPLPRVVDRFEARGPGPVRINHAQPQHNGQREDEVDGEFQSQLLTLLMRCRDIVTNVKSSLGYVPYHPL